MSGDPDALAKGARLSFSYFARLWDTIVDDINLVLVEDVIPTGVR
jgi:hypothetical protein